MSDGIVERVEREDGSVAEVVVRAPIAAIRLAAEIEGRDLSDREIAEAALRVAQDEHDEAERQKIAASTISNVAIALALVAIDDSLDVAGGYRGVDGAEIRIPRSLVNRVAGAKLGISETADGDVILRWRERAERPIEPEEMRT